MASHNQATNRQAGYTPPTLRRLGTLVELTQMEKEITGFEDAMDEWKVTKINEKKGMTS